MAASIDSSKIVSSESGVMYIPFKTEEGKDMRLYVVVRNRATGEIVKQTDQTIAAFKVDEMAKNLFHSIRAHVQNRPDSQLEPSRVIYRYQDGKVGVIQNRENSIKNYISQPKRTDIEEVQINDVEIDYFNHQIFPLISDLCNKYILIQVGISDFFDLDN